MLKHFSKTFSIYGLGPAFSKFVGFFLVPVYTRLFCPEEYGVIDLFNTVIHLFTVLINLQIYSAVGRYFHQIENKKLLVSTGLWNEIFLSIIIVSSLIFFSTDINKFLLDDISYNRIFILALLWMPFNVISNYLSTVMRYENKPLIFILISMLQTISKVVVSLSTILVLDFGIAGIYIGHLAGDTIALCLFLFFLRKHIGIKINFSLLKKLLLFSLPLVPAVFALYGSEFLNRIIMLKYMTLSSIGIFAVALKVASAFALLRLAFRLTWEPFIYANLKRIDHKKQIVRIYKMTTILLCFLVCTITLFSKEILYVITTRDYFAAASIIGVLSIYFVFDILLDMIGIGPRIVHKTIFDSVSRILGVIVSVLSMLFLIPLYGVMGAALSLCVGGGTSLIISWYYTDKLYPIGYPKVFTLLIISSMFLVVILNYSFTIPFILKFTGALMFFVILFYYRDVMKKLINSPSTL